MTISPPLTLCAINSILKYEWRLPWLDFYFHRFNGYELIIAGSHDFSYYHNIEIIAQRPIKIQGNTEWSTGVELKFIKAISTPDLTPTDPVRIMQFYSDDGLELTITAESFTYNLDTVFYYARENLQPGERIAK
ncbi:hypothetical protein [Providencia sp. PROV255]|uniref:hypothetical protein n=1 Tax=Providencia sp. PROV255 TaxID=2949943 RepID=UPI002349A847|nr:hypothetical protein [Providencia sp. PROV255]